MTLIIVPLCSPNDNNQFLSYVSVPTWFYRHVKVNQRKRRRRKRRKRRRRRKKRYRRRRRKKRYRRRRRRSYSATESSLLSVGGAKCNT
jgi:hypothetical protein